MSTTVKFSDVEVGTKFFYEEKEYTKTAKVKISCCKSVNAQLVGSSARSFFKDSILVEVVSK
jgi:hypothetical protein